ncbi:hypothetical protein C8Q72DRAFT_841248 [Fomitopsis betulina]|nr:hypothetical protein C8Q72DRAFT_841248 [Fomitopsis betulina]
MNVNFASEPERRRAMMPRQMQRLPPSTQSKIRSTQILTSLPQIISELVQNALDAGASHIDVGVDCEDWACWVRDDGCGIARDDFDALASGGQAARYSTSKAYSPASLDEVSTFGFRGEALASAADVSCLEISSRTARSRESWSVILKEDKALYHGPSLRWRRESAGTVVSVRDAFYNLPIRRRSHPSTARTLELVRRDVEAFALMFPGATFSVENTQKAKSGAPGSNKVMVVPKTGSTVAAFRHIYGRALAEHVEEVHEQIGDMRLEGFLSLDGSPSKTYQYFYINKHLMSTCDLHRIIESKFSRSSFAKHAYEEDGETSRPRSGARRSPRKCEKKPVYVLNLTVPPRQVDNCLEPAKAMVHLQNWEAVSTLVSSVVDTFLLRHGFLYLSTPRACQEQARADSPAVVKKRKVVRTSHINSDTVDSTSSFKDVTILPERHVDISPLAVYPTDASDEGPEVVWTDPMTLQKFVVDTRTGNSYPVNSRVGEDPNEGPQRKRVCRTAESMPPWMKQALETNQSYAALEPRIPAVSLSTAFTEDALDWPTSQPRHPQWRGSKRRGHDCLSHTSHPHASHSRPGRFNNSDLVDAQVLGQVDRKFIACVIHTNADGDNEPEDVTQTTGDRQRRKVLVLIDQHAADERVRVERFLQDLCDSFMQHRPDAAGMQPQLQGVRTRLFDPPVPILLTEHEARRLGDEEVRVAFRRWGLTFADDFEDAGLAAHATPYHSGGEGGSQSGYSQVNVVTVPDLLGDKLLNGDELRDLVKGYIAKLASEGTPTLPLRPHVVRSGAEEEGESSSSVGWQKAMRWCPRELHELVNSKACRGAIMFNDALTHDQCTRLVRQLAQTALPFQCAHGRPSLVPLTEIALPVANATRDITTYTSPSMTSINWANFT